MKNVNKKGFSLIELLAVIVIIGILSGVSIAAYSKFVKSAKSEKDEQNEKIIINAAKSYLESNTSYKPKEIGETVQIYLRTLKEANFLKEDVVNSEGVSCMDESYIEVHKTGYKDYTYTSILKCGENDDRNKNAPKPVVDNLGITSSNIKTASLNITIHGDSSNSTEIESYSYTIIGKTTSESNKKENYSSGTLPGQGKKKITIKNIKLNEYIDITQYNTFDIQVIVRNTKGGYEKRLFKNISFEDTIPPICKDISGASSGENDWINKNGKRIITVGCDDGDGSGCQKDTFSQVWPREKLQTIEKSTITIKDNTKSGNPTKCEVLVNLDGVGPTITVNAKTINNEDAFKAIVVKDGAKGTINDNDYRYNSNGWLNKTYYPNNVKYVIKVEDDINLGSYTWQTNGNESTSKEFVHSGNNRLKEQNFEIYFSDEGVRTGTLTVYDKAGNSTSITINAKIDRTDPTCTNGGDSTTWVNTNRTIYWGCNDTLSKCNPNYSGGNKEYTKTKETDSISSYTIMDNAGNSVKCPARVANVYVDKTDPICDIKGESTTWTKNNRTISWNCSDEHSKCDPSYTGGSRTFNNTIKTYNIPSYTIKDNAGNVANCNSKSANVYIDKTPPQCGSSGDNSSWTKNNVTIYWSCKASSELNQSGCNPSYSGGNRTFNSTTKTASIQSYTIKDNVGNETKCPSRTANVYVDKTAPRCNISDYSSWTTGSRTATITCTDGVAGTESGCREPKSKSRTIGFSESTAFINYPNRYLTFYDNAGNWNSCDTNAGYYIDNTKPRTPYILKHENGNSGIYISGGSGWIEQNSCPNTPQDSYTEQYCDVYMHVKNDQTTWWVTNISYTDMHSGFGDNRNRAYVYYYCLGSSGGGAIDIKPRQSMDTVGTLSSSGYQRCNAIYTVKDIVGNESEQLFVRYHFTYYD